MTNYFSEHNKKQNESLEKFNKKVKLLNYERQQEEYEVEQIIRNRKTERIEYLKARGNKQVDSIWLNHLQRTFKFVSRSEVTQEMLEREEQYCIENAEQLV